MNQRKLIIGSLEISTEDGKIWINDIFGKCILRANKIEFLNNLQKFDFIDINEKTAVLSKAYFGDSFKSKEAIIIQFLVEVLNLLMSKEATGEFKIEDIKKLKEHLIEYFKK